VVLGYLASILAAPVFWAQIALELAFLAIWFLFERVTSCALCKNRSGLTSYGRSRFRGRRKPRPQPLNLSYDSQRRESKPATVPLQFTTPAAGRTFYDDPSLTIVKPGVSSQSPLSPQFATLSCALEDQLGPLPKQWTMHLSSDRRVFFVHSESGEATWLDPRLGDCILSPMPRSADFKVQTRCCAPAALTQKARSDVNSPVGTPIPGLSPVQRARIWRWVQDVRAKERARSTRLLTLRSRARMAKMQKYMQPFAI